VLYRASPSGLALLVSRPMKNFYEVLLPEKGKYCVATKKGEEKLKQHFVDSVDELVDLVNKVKDDGANVYFALGGFNDDSSRVAANCHSLRSFFFDLDCKGGDTYDTQEDAIDALQVFCKEVKLPRPTLVNSGNGIHAYWPFTESVSRDEWVSTARRLKDLCSYHKFNVDRKVTSDAARILRCPETINYNGGPKKAELLTSSKQYDYSRIKALIDYACEEAGINVAPPIDLSKAKRELDEDTKALLRLDNIESKFSKIARRSLEGSGCAHIKLALEEPNGCSEPMWRACLSVAFRCSDGATAIHKLSEGHDEYDPRLTEEKASSTLGPYRCETFDDEEPGKCDGCQHRGKISSPIQLGKVLKKPKPESEPDVDPIEADGALEKALFPFHRVNGSIYYQPPPEFDTKKKQKIEIDPILVYENRIDVVNRVVNKSDGECTLIRLHLPKDGIKEFYLPNYVTQSPADFRKLLASEGVATSTKSMDRLMEYTTKWIKYLQSMKSADKMREQLGWSDDNLTFAWGDKEFSKNGERHSPPSSKTREIVACQKEVGEFEAWKNMFNNFGKEGFETHAFAAMSGFGSPLLKFTGFEGVVINLFSGASGTGKTAVLKAALSVWGDPKGLMVGDGTQLARFHRTAVLRNTPIGIDEATGIDPKTLSEFIYYLSLGKTKIRMQASSNAERENLGSWSTIGVMTSNNSYYDKLNQLKASADGESARLMEFHIKKPAVMPDDATGKQFFDAVNYNYGHAGPIFINYVINNMPEVMHILEAVTFRFQREFRSETKHRFWSAAVAANITGGMIAYKLGLHDIDMEKVYQHVLKELKKVSTTSESIHADAFEVLNEFIALSANNTLVINSKSDSKITYHVEPTKTPTNGNGLYIRHETDTGETYILMKALADYMAKRQYSRQRFEEELTKRNILIKSHCPKRMASGWDGGISNSTQNTYKIKLPNDTVITE